jgi:hypothetical protein
MLHNGLDPSMALVVAGAAIVAGSFFAFSCRLPLPHATMSSAGAGCGLQTRRRVALAAVRFGLRGETHFIPSLQTRLLLPPSPPHATMSSAGAGCGLQTRRRVALAAVRFGLRGETHFIPPLGFSCRLPLPHATMSSAGAGCGLQTRRRVALAAVRFGLRGETTSSLPSASHAVFPFHMPR